MTQPPGTYPPAYPTQTPVAPQPAPRRGLGAGAVIGISLGALVLGGIVGAGVMIPGVVGAQAQLEEQTQTLAAAELQAAEFEASAMANEELYAVCYNAYSDAAVALDHAISAYNTLLDANDAYFVFDYSTGDAKATEASGFATEFNTARESATSWGC